MKARFIAVFFIGFLLLIQTIQAQTCLLYPVTLHERVTNSTLIIEGMVMDKKSYWNDAHSQILTAYFIDVYKTFKGTSSTQTIAIVVQGGQVDMDILKVNPEMKFNPGDYGVFMLTGLSDDFIASEIQQSRPAVEFYKGYAWQQSFIAFNEGKVHDLFYSYKDNKIENLYAQFTELLGGSATVQKKTPEQYLVEENAVDVKAITGFSPAIVTAGTLGPSGVLTINGVGFGAVRGTGFVRFPNADDGGATFEVVGTDLATDYILWSDVQVIVRVPSGAGTGTFQLRNNGGTTFNSPTPLTIDYNALDIIFDPGGGAQRYEPDLINDNGVAAGDYTLTFNTGFFGNAPAVASFRDALANWVFKTGVNFVDNGATTSAIASNNAGDGVNIVSFNGGLGVGVLGVSFSSWNGCAGGGGVHWFLNDVDLLFATVPGGSTWYFGCSAAGIGGAQFDFESVAVHELGHHHQLGHIINTAGVMHFSIANGQVKRLIATNDQAGGNYVMSHSTVNNPCGPVAMTMISGPAPGCAPLPVELLTFDAILNDRDDVDLTWTTVSETNNHYFSIERSSNLITFTEIGRVNGAGNSALMLNYQFTDENPLPGVSYYRLHQVDYDGTSSNTTYKVIVIDPVQLQTVLIYPDPATNFIQFKLPDNGNYDIRIFDASGKLVMSENLNSEAVLNVEEIENGFYFVQAICSHGKIHTGKFIISR